MITHLLFKGLNSFNIGSSMFRKILAIIIAVLIFSLVFLAVKFTKVEVPNFNRNLIMLAVVDISAFGLVMWKFGPPKEQKEENEVIKKTEKEERVETEDKDERVKTEEKDERVETEEKVETEETESESDKE